MIKDVFLFLCSIIFVMIVLELTGCSEFQENKLVKDQAITFEQEIAYRQRKEIELENRLKKANEVITKLEKQLECKQKDTSE